MNNENRLDAARTRAKVYNIASAVLVTIVALLFAFPLYWIITGAFKSGADINAAQPVWWPREWVTINFEKLMSKRSAPLFDFTIPALKISAFGYTLTLGQTLIITGPTGTNVNDVAVALLKA